MIKYISQKGEDGFGHQLLGMMSLLSLCKGYEYIVYVHYPHDGQFEHVSKEEKIQLKDYIHAFYEALGYIYPCNFQCFPKKRIMERKRNNLNFKSTEDLQWDLYTYVFDNSWSQEGIGKLIYGFGFEPFLKNGKLPSHNFNKDDVNVVIHLRGGDGDGRAFGTKQNMSILNRILEKIYDKHNKAMFYFHTNNDNVNENILKSVSNDRYKVYNKKTPVLDSFSQMINSDILIVGDSSLSIAASYVCKGIVLVPSKLSCAENIDKDIHPLKGISHAISFEKYLSNNM
jgi:hypothetical protein